MRCVPSAFPLTTTIWHGDVPSYWNVSVKVSGGPASRMYCLGPKATVIGAAGTCKVRTVEVSATEESRNNRLNNEILFMEPPGKIRLLGFSLVLSDIPELPILQTKFPGRGSQISSRYGWARGFSSTNFVHWINGVESDSKGQQAGPDPDANCDPPYRSLH